MTIDRLSLEKFESEKLAPYAARSSESLGRAFPEEKHIYRTEFQRDRERIIHSRAFRRLEYKTQVFINHEGDHYRTRLTHTIEVSQISRSIARAMRLNEDLSEAIALAHDLGHTPFGHAGEKKLNELLSDHGGFEHNRQSLRVVDILEKRYTDFDGLNLTWETREGIIKHSSDYDRPDYKNFAPEQMPSLEAQIIDLADEIAYNNHDLDDGISSGLLAFEEIEKLEIWKIAAGLVRKKDLSSRKDTFREMIRAIINLLVTDLLNTTVSKIAEMKISDYADIKNAKIKIASFSDEIKKANTELKRFLKKRMYQHYRVARMTIKAENVIEELFTIFTARPETMPDEYQSKSESDGLMLAVTDYIAGMTDRFALEEYKKLTDPSWRV